MQECDWLLRALSSKKHLINKSLEKRSRDNTLIRSVEVEPYGWSRYGYKYFSIAQKRHGKRDTNVLIPVDEKDFLMLSLIDCLDVMTTSINKQ